MHTYSVGIHGDAEKHGTLRNGTERNKTEVIDAQYGRGRLEIATVCLSVRTLILHSVTATKTGQASAENYVKRM